MVALLVSILVTALMVAVVVLVAKRRPVGKPLTWGEAFVAATFVFALMFVAYGVLPDRFLIWADNELGWRSDKYFLGDSGFNVFGRGRILISYQIFRDLIASGIYVIALAGQFFLWSWWQKRGRRAAAAGQPQVTTSAYGRPLVKGS